MINCYTLRCVAIYILKKKKCFKLVKQNDELSTNKNDHNRINWYERNNIIVI